MNLQQTARTLTLAAALMLAFGSAAASAETAKFLGDRHVERGLACDACHEKDMKIKVNGDLDVWSSCHGDYKAMIAKTEKRYEVNPHAQHEGALPCSECHKGHKPGVNYCGGCHNYTYKVP